MEIYVKREILHHRALNVLNRLFFEVGSVGSEADGCPLSTRESYNLFFSALPAPVPLYLLRVVLKL